MPSKQDQRLIAVLICLVPLGILASDYAHTRSAARLALILTRLGSGTPLESFAVEFGPAVHHFTEVPMMREWGPSTDPDLLAHTELYYFFYPGLPHRYVTVYVDKSTRRALVVSWKSM